ncbi:MAG: hypothetical protein ACI9DK_002637 [Vicingaceae bacterium]|jgi:hypothetical protein|tara:strand:- start:657 stop:767 length:111 start_codon:yes stop_codon:yes gene_type:complete
MTAPMVLDAACGFDELDAWYNLKIKHLNKIEKLHNN